MSAETRALEAPRRSGVVGRSGRDRSRGGARRVKTFGQVVLNAVLWVGAFACMFPFLWMLSTALKPETNALTNNFFLGFPVSWNNFVQAWDFFPFGRFMINSAIMSVGEVAVVLLASTTGGYVFARLQFPGKERFFLVYVATLMIPGTVLVIPLFLIAEHLHLYNSYLGLFLPVSFSAFGTFFMRQFFRTLPEELRDSARIDGASELWIFARVMLPLVRAGAAVLGVFTFIAAWGDFLWPIVVTQSENLYTLNVGLSEFQGQYGGYWSYEMAGCTLAIVPAIIVVIALQKYLVKGLAFTSFGGR